MVEAFARPVAEAFIQVTVLVAVMIGLFASVQHRLGHRLTRFLLAHWRAGPLLGALAGVIPGCGGAILVVPLFVRSRVSFGTLVAALVATMGDASFVVIAADPRLALTLHTALFCVGVVSGLVVDLLGYAPRPGPADVLVGQPAGGVAVAGVGPSSGFAGDVAAGVHPTTGAGGPLHAASEWVSPAVLDRVARLGVGLGPTVVAFWAFVAVGVTITAPVTAQLWQPSQVPRLVSGLDPFLSVGVGGTLVAFVVARRARNERQGRVVPPPVSGLAAVLREAAQESARITVWIAVAFVAIEVATRVGFVVAGALSVVGIAGVVIGALVGLVPGCAPQIVLTALYVSGTVPFATLLANALSQDGDALLPLILMDRRAAVIASVLTTLPGFLGGTAVLALGLAP